MRLQKAHLPAEYPHRTVGTDPYQALATAVLKNAIGIWKNGNARQRSDIAKWLKTEKYIRSCEFWCIAAGVDVDWLREQLNKYQEKKAMGKESTTLENSLDTTKRPYQKKRKIGKTVAKTNP